MDTDILIGVDIADRVFTLYVTNNIAARGKHVKLDREAFPAFF